MIYLIFLVCVMLLIMLVIYYKNYKSLKEKIDKLKKENDSLAKKSSTFTNNINKFDEKNFELVKKSNLKYISSVTEDSIKINTGEKINFDEFEGEILSREQRKIFNAMEETNENMFITGKAGTGKSYVLKYFKFKTKKKVLYTAPTGIAALNIEGVTLHSAFGYKNLIENAEIILSNNMIELLSNLDTIIIDEISMVRVDVFTQINLILQKANNNREIFGGKQIILLGDLFQLPPVADKEECAYFSDKYGGEYFFNSPAYKEGNFKFYELDEIFRQKNVEFKGILNNIRVGNIKEEDLESLNKHVVIEAPKRILEIVPKKSEANYINTFNLNKLDTEKYIYKANVIIDNGNLKETDFTCDFNLELKVGAMIMMLVNDQEYKRWVNGTLGIVSYLSPTEIKVIINDSEYEISPVSFNKYKCVYNRQERKLEYIVESSVVQYPLILAYAITIHKSQGMTYQQIVCNLDSCFASGQAYVALSRCANYENLYLTSNVKPSSIITNKEVLNFYERIKQTNKLQNSYNLTSNNDNIKLLIEKIVYTESYAGRFDLVSGIDDFKIDIDCDEERHLYIKNNVILPSVTEILHKGMYDGAPFMYLENARTRGSIIHEEIENYLKKGLIGETRECLKLIHFFENNKDLFKQKAIFEFKTYGECGKAKREICFKQIAMYCEGIYYITGEVIKKAYLIWLPGNGTLSLIDLTKEFGEPLSINKYTEQKTNWNMGNHFFINGNDYISIGIPHTLILNSFLSKCTWEEAKKNVKEFEPKYNSRNINKAESYLYTEYIKEKNIELYEPYWINKYENSVQDYPIYNAKKEFMVKPTIFLSSYIQLEGYGTENNPYRLDERYIKEKIENEKAELLKKELQKKKNTERIVLKCNNIGEIISEYQSIKKASEDNCIGYSSIRDSCSGKQRFAGNFVWVYKDEYDNKKNILFNEKYKNRTPNENKAKKIYMIDDYGNIIKEFNSINEASRYTGINNRSIRKAANNKC